MGALAHHTTSADQVLNQKMVQMSLPALTLGSWVRILPVAWMFVCVYSMFVLSCVDSGLATG
jgi:hypothetical protein